MYIAQKTLDLVSESEGEKELGNDLESKHERSSRRYEWRKKWKHC